MIKNDITPEQIFEYLEGKYDKETELLIEKRIGESKELQEIVENIRQSKLFVNTIYKQNSIDVEEGMALVKKKIKKQKTMRLKLVFRKYAAILFLPLIISLSFLIYQHINDKNAKPQYVEIKAAKGSIVHLELPDNSEMWLNSDSYAKYSTDFTQNRNIYIEGEGFFIVKHDAHSPFRVKTKSGLLTEVHGTEFNVKAYCFDETEEITLKEGLVSVIIPKNKKPIYLEPGEMIEYDTNNMTVFKKVVHTYNKIAWKNGILLFRDATLKEIFHTIERHFNIQILVKNEHLIKDIRYRATFKEDNIEEILDYLSELVNLKWEMKETNTLSESAIGNRIILVEIF